MKQSKGYTLIELLVVIIFVSMFGLILFNVIMGVNGSSNISFGVGGMIESRCVNGYQYTIDNMGNARQVLSELGKGVKCQ